MTEKWSKNGDRKKKPAKIETTPPQQEVIDERLLSARESLAQLQILHSQMETKSARYIDNDLLKIDILSLGVSELQIWNDARNAGSLDEAAIVLEGLRKSKRTIPYSFGSFVGNFLSNLILAYKRNALPVEIKHFKETLTLWEDEEVELIKKVVEEISRLQQEHLQRQKENKKYRENLVGLDVDSIGLEESRFWQEAQKLENFEDAARLSRQWSEYVRDFNIKVGRKTSSPQATWVDFFGNYLQVVQGLLYNKDQEVLEIFKKKLVLKKDL